jgi:hypothetical protein
MSARVFLTFFLAALMAFPQSPSSTLTSIANDNTEPKNERVSYPARSTFFDFISQ